MELSKQDIEEGRKLLQKSREIKDLWTILVREILSGVPQNIETCYERCCREILAVSPEKINEESVISILKKNGYRFPKKKGEKLAEVAKIYFKNNGDRLKLIGRLAYRIGRKSFDLILEDLGDDDAVAVDRHVARFFNLESDRKIGIGNKTYDEAQRMVRKLAREKNEKPAVIERAIWRFMKKS